jgi:peroxiredoxin
MRDDHGPQIQLADPVPWFSAKTIAGAQIDLHVQAGRWIVLAFLGFESDPQTARELGALMSLRALFDEAHLIVYGILPAAPADPAPYIAASCDALGFFMDYDGALARQFGAHHSPRTIVLDQMLRAVANIAWDDPNPHEAQLRGLLQSLPPVDESVGVPMIAPILIVPRVFEFAICDFLVELYDSQGGVESGFLLNQDGKTATIVDHHYKRRQDLVLGDPSLRTLLRDRIARRIVPAMERHFQFRPTRMDRYLVSCYDSASGGGYFSRHRDNLLPGARHRRFACSINLNGGYQGCDLVFPEFGKRTYRPPVGGAVIFATSTLHQVLPITEGRRLVFVPFLYGEADVAQRLADNALLGSGGVEYQGGTFDMLFPEADEAAP